MTLALDHIVLAAPDLEVACESFARETGCVPRAGGPHEGLGTHNALVSLGDDLYLEIIAPDPRQPDAPNLAATLRALDAPELFHWALRTDDLGATATALHDQGLQPTPPIETSRTQPEGGRLVWDLMGLPGLGGAWPFFIDWRDCTHPARHAPRAGVAQRLVVALPTGHAAALPFADVEGIEIRDGAPALTFGIESARGLVEWHREAPLGFFA